MRLASLHLHLYSGWPIDSKMWHDFVSTQSPLKSLNVQQLPVAPLACEALP